MVRSLLLATVVALVAATNSSANAPAVPGADLPQDADVRVFGVYHGAYPPGARRGFRVHPQSTVTISVGAVRRPVILVLTAYEPVLWKIEASKGTVARVIASGYHKQAVEGLDAKVPVTYSSHEAGDENYFYAYQEPPAAAPAAPAAAPVAPAAPAVAPARPDWIVRHEQEEIRAKYTRLVTRVKELTGHEVKGLQGSYGAEKFTVR